MRARRLKSINLDQASYQCEIPILEEKHRGRYLGKINRPAVTASIAGSRIRNRNKVHKNAANDNSWPVP